VMIRLFGLASVFLALALFLVACVTDPGGRAAAPALSGVQSAKETNALSMGFQPLKFGVGGGDAGGNGGSGSGGS